MAKRNDAESSKAGRLRGAVAGMRLHAGGVLNPKAPDQRGSIGRTGVRFPNSASALRQHVAQVLKEPTSKPQVQLRLRPRTDAHSVTLKEDSPPPGTESTFPSSIAAPAELGRIVRAARDGQNLSQAALAIRAGTGRRFIVELEAGKPTAALGLALAVCKALGIELVATSKQDE